MQDTKKFTLSPAVAIIIAGVVIALAIIFVNRFPAPGKALAEGEKKPADVSVRPPSEKDHIIGSPTAPIVLIEYSDFQCPFCNVVYPTLKRIVAESNGTVAWVHRQYPLTSIHPQALPAALASECVAEQLGSTGFWKFAEALYTNQKSLSPEYFAQVATSLGVNKVQYTQCVATAKYQKVIDADMAEAEKAGGNGTPFTVVLQTKSGKAVPASGALPYAQFMNIITNLK